VLYASMIKDMETARHSIHLQYFICSADAFTERLKAILMAKARAGVEVRLLYDPLGSRAHLSRAYVSSLQAAGIRIAPTSPLYQLHTISYRNHRNITVIDDTIGYGCRGVATRRCVLSLARQQRFRGIGVRSLRLG
jgi:cardiolipin synthase A/B